MSDTTTTQSDATSDSAQHAREIAEQAKQKLIVRINMAVYVGLMVVFYGIFVIFAVIPGIQAWLQS